MRPDEAELHAAPPILLAEGFDHEALTAVRHAVGRVCARAGLAGRRLDDFVLSVNELMTNAVRYAGGHGSLTVWCAEDALYCEVSDRGPGIPAEVAAADRTPLPLALGGRGLWLTRRLCDSMRVATGPAGTTIRIGMAVQGSG